MPSLQFTGGQTAHLVAYLSAEVLGSQGRGKELTQMCHSTSGFHVESWGTLDRHLFVDDVDKPHDGPNVGHASAGARSVGRSADRLIGLQSWRGWKGVEFVWAGGRAGWTEPRCGGPRGGTEQHAHASRNDAAMLLQSALPRWWTLFFWT